MKIMDNPNENPFTSLMTQLTINHSLNLGMVMYTCCEPLLTNTQALDFNPTCMFISS